MRALFRFDAGAGIGAGHAARCTVLANALVESGMTCTVLTSSETVKVFPSVGEQGFDILERDQDSPVDGLGQLPDGPYDIAVLDHYDCGERTERLLRDVASRLIVIDDLLRAHSLADVLIDQTLGRDGRDYAPLTQPSCLRLTGSGYAMVHQSFAAARRRDRPARSGLSSIAVCFGGTDPSNATGATLSALAEWAAKEPTAKVSVTVVLGAGAPHRASVATQIGALGIPVQLKSALTAKEMAALYAESDLVIGAAGGSAWERSCVGVPSLVLKTGPDQSDNITALSRSGGSIVLNSIDSIHDVLCELNADPDRLNRMGAQALSICDGDGARRLAASLWSDAQAKELRCATRRVTEDDAACLYDWQTAPETRRYFRNPEVPSWETHTEWLSRSLSAPTRSLNLLVSPSGDPLGYFSLDDSPAGTEISLLVAPGRHGQGIGTAILRAASRMRPTSSLIAEVNRENTASQALFRSFEYQTQDGINFILEPSFRNGS